MKSEWRVMSSPIDDKKYYRVFRIIDTNAVDHSGNREFSGGYTSDREEAMQRAEALNAKEDPKDA